jgi:hypothetical protein
MTDAETGDPDRARPPIPPLPPRPPDVPSPRSETPAAEPAEGTEWWRSPPPPPPRPDSDPPGGEASPPAPDASGAEDGPPADEGRRWHWDQVRGEWREAWDTHGQEAIQAAHEIGVTIGETVVAHMPNPHAAAEQRGLDIRWLRLAINVPAIALALLVTWGGDSPAEHMARSIARDGPFALFGWLLIPALALGLFVLTPVGGVLGEALVGVLRSVLYGIGRLIVRAWRVRFTGYLLRLVVAVAAWSVAIALARLMGRAVIHVLTGA